MLGYKLEGKKIIPCESMLEWAMYFETANRHVALEMVWGMRVSTVFLGIDHNHSFSGDPVLFETMVFVGRTSEDVEMRRYCTWDEAEAGHKDIIANIKRHPWSLIVLPQLEYIWERIILRKLQVAINKFWELKASWGRDES